MLRDLRQDLPYGLRSLRRNPGFTVLVVLSLAVGIGANAAVFSLINFVFLRSLPVRDPGGLVLFASGFGAGSSGGRLRSGPIGLYSYPLYQRLRAANHSFQSLAAQQSGHSDVVVRAEAAGTSAEVANGRAVGANYFEVVGVPAVRGRTFLPEDETAPGADPVVVLSHSYWQRRFGGNPGVVGSTLGIAGTRYTVVGVAAPGFVGTRVGVEVTDFWVPMTMHGQLLGRAPLFATSDQGWLVIVGRLLPGVSMPAAQAEANLILRSYLDEQPALAPRTGPGARIELAPGGKGISPLRQDSIRAPLVALMVGVGLLLAIVCLNVSHLLLARAVRRRREMSIRGALGATRGRLLRQLLVEGLLLSALGGLAAALTASWMVDGLIALVPASLPLTLDVHLDRAVLAFLALLALGTAVLLGAVPAWQAGRLDLRATLQGDAHAVVGGSRRVVSRLLLVSQMVLSLVLVVSAGLFSRTLGKLRELDKGFDEEHVLLLEMKTDLAGLSREATLGFQDDLLARVGALPGVRSASLSRFELLSGSHSREGISVPGTTTSVEVEEGIVTPAYFQTTGMALLHGRPLLDSDGAGSAPVAVVNATFARRIFGDRALGQRFRVGGPSSAGEVLEVVGVVRDVKNDGLRELPRPMIYRAVAQAPTFLDSLQVRTAGEPALLAEQVRRAVHDLQPEVPIAGVRTMRSQVERALTGERALATLSSAFGFMALFLVCVGLYGVVSQWAAQRQREIGVRIALGSTARGVRWMVMRQAIALAMIGVAVGLPAAVAVARLLRGFLYELDPADPVTLGGAVLVMLAVAALAAYLPARRASRVDPMVALRSD